MSFISANEAPPPHRPRLAWIWNRSERGEKGFRKWTGRNKLSEQFLTTVSNFSFILLHILQLWTFLPLYHVDDNRFEQKSFNAKKISQTFRGLKDFFSSLKNIIIEIKMQDDKTRAAYLRSTKTNLEDRFWFSSVLGDWNQHFQAVRMILIILKTDIRKLV